MKPKSKKKKRASSFYSNSNDEDDAQEKKDDATASASDSDDADNTEPWVLDEDHALLLKSCTPLLQSRNSGVGVIGVGTKRESCGKAEQ